MLLPLKYILISPLLSIFHLTSKIPSSFTFNSFLIVLPTFTLSECQNACRVIFLDRFILMGQLKTPMGNGTNTEFRFHGLASVSWHSWTPSMEISACHFRCAGDNIFVTRGALACSALTLYRMDIYCFKTAQPCHLAVAHSGFALTG